ncbi:MAG: hypothetical protein KBD01_02155 [Acidobacteria bacterium]|nr:hypothetical protein [Acidobacteriota bacterium]
MGSRPTCARWLFAVLCLPVVLVLAAASSRAEPDAGALAHPTIQEVLTMVEARVGDVVIEARIKQMDDVPSLTGTEIAELKRRGVSDNVLYRLVQAGRVAAVMKDAPPPREIPDLPNYKPAQEKRTLKSGKERRGEAPAASASRASTPATTEPQPTPRTPQEDAVEEPQFAPESPLDERPLLGPDESIIRIVMRSLFPVTFYKITLDGKTVASRGKQYEREEITGRRAETPREFRFGPLEVHEIVVPAGEHRLSAGFSVAQLDTGYGKYARARYISQGVDSLPATDANRGALCQLQAGQVCTVTVNFGRRRRLAAATEYSVDYMVELGIPDAQVAADRP